jgi:hypothetical protein
VIDIFDDNIDAAIKLEDGYTYTVVITTPKNLLTAMDKGKNNFLSPGFPMIVVRQLTKDVIEQAIEAYAGDDAYYLKLYAATFDNKTLNVLKERQIARSQFLNDLLEKGESIEIENYALIDFDIKDL